MKKSLARSRLAKPSGFTLVELLVVISIIAILASVSLWAGNAAIKAAKRAKANNMASQIQTAALAYFTEYGIYPVGAATADGTAPASIADTDAANWGNLMDALCGNIYPSTGLAAPASAVTNGRSIIFLTFRTSDVDTNNAPLNPLPVGTELYFFIAMDADNDGVLGTGSSTAVLPYFATGTSSSLTMTGGSSTAGVAVWGNCTGITAPASGTMSCNAGFWVHTY